MKKYANRKTLYRFILILSYLLLSIVMTDCSYKSTYKCVNSISTTTLDTNGSSCINKCDCNNQDYEGECIKKKCIAYKRNPCSRIGDSKTCKPKLLSQKCNEGIQICRDTGLNVDRFGDCICLTNKQEQKRLHH